MNIYHILCAGLLSCTLVQATNRRVITLSDGEGEYTLALADLEAYLAKQYNYQVKIQVDTPEVVNNDGSVLVMRSLGLNSRDCLVFTVSRKTWDVLKLRHKKLELSQWAKKIVKNEMVAGAVGALIAGGIPLIPQDPIYKLAGSVLAGNIAFKMLLACDVALLYWIYRKTKGCAHELALKSKVAHEYDENSVFGLNLVGEYDGSVRLCFYGLKNVPCCSNAR